MVGIYHPIPGFMNRYLGKALLMPLPITNHSLTAVHHMIMLYLERSSEPNDSKPYTRICSSKTQRLTGAIKRGSFQM